LLPLPEKISIHLLTTLSHLEKAFFLILITYTKKLKVTSYKVTNKEFIKLKVASYKVINILQT
jgi:hypothetical protein